MFLISDWPFYESKVSDLSLVFCQENNIQHIYFSLYNTCFCSVFTKLSLEAIILPSASEVAIS